VRAWRGWEPVSPTWSPTRAAP